MTTEVGPPTCGRISIVFARGGVTDQNIASLIFGTVANLVWASSLVFLFLGGQYWFMVGGLLFGLVVLNFLVKPEEIFWKIRHALRIVTVLIGGIVWVI